MTSFTIYYGGKYPMIARGVHQCNLLEFAEKSKGWHTFKNDRITKRAIIGLQKKGYIEVKGDQFRFTYPKE